MIWLSRAENPNFLQRFPKGNRGRAEGSRARDTRMETWLMKALLAVVLGFSLLTAAHAQERSGPLRIEITEGVIEPVPIAVAPFIAENAAAADFAREITGVVAADLTGTGLFRNLPREAYISQVTDFNGPVAYADWKAKYQTEATPEQMAAFKARRPNA